MTDTAAEAAAGAITPAGQDRRAVVAVAGAAVALGALARVWQIRGRGHLMWADSRAFVASAESSWASLRLWAGPRTAAVPAVLKLAGDGGYVPVQAAVAVVCWATLAAVVAGAVGERGARWLAAGAVVVFSLTTPVVMWERSVLSESLAVSLTALVAAAVVRLVEDVTLRRVAALLAALALWLTTRDTHAVVAAVGAVAVAVGLLVDELWWRWHRPLGPGAPAVRPGAPARRALGVLALGAAGLSGVSALAADHGERQAYPMRNVFEVRVLPYQDRVRWFAAHGMPHAGEFLGPDARRAHVEPGQAQVVAVPDDDPVLQDWLAWVRDDGRSAYARFVVTHPLYLVAEPLRSPERAFNNAEGDRAFYAPVDQRSLPLVDGFALPTVVVVVLGGMVAGWAVGRRMLPPLVAAGAVVALLAVPHGVAAWHSDGMETARHLVVPALQLHLGVLLMVVGALAAEWQRRAERAVAGRLPSGDG
jgi:hypothetical protein